jgi:homoserine kinase type II
VTYRPRLTNRRGPSWWRQAARAVRPFLEAEQNHLLAAELKFLTGFGKVRMPRGAIHGDLFCDNVLFEGDRVSGIIDFGFAATDFLAYDLAITVNDWCIVDEGPDAGALRPELVDALTGAYQDVRELTADERAQWPSLLRAAALRFWLSRLYDLHLPRPGELVHAHDPAHFERILRNRILHATPLPEPARSPRVVSLAP